MRRAIHSLRWLSVAPLVISAAALAMLSTGCAAPESNYERLNQDQEKALDDPMNYSPDMSDTDIPSWGSYNPKAVDRDWNMFWNP